MENLLCNRLPVPIINIKDDDDCIIEGINTTISNTQIVDDWDAKNCKKLKCKLSVCENDKILEDVFKDYTRILREQALNFKEKNVLKEKILRHVKVFYMYYALNDGIPIDVINYLECMENILIFLCNLELEVIRRVKKKDKDYCKKIKEVAQSLIRILSIYLLNNEKSILHVLLRLDSRRDSQSWKDVMHIIYRYYLITMPIKDRSEECFCRNFLLFQKWKSITEKSKHMGMDKIMYFRFNRSPETEVISPMLRSILNPGRSIVDVLDVLAEDRRTDIDNYFRYIEEKEREDDVCLPQSINLDSEDEEDGTQRLQFGPSEKEKRSNGLIKSEKPTQENVHYVDVPASNGQVVCIIEDDSDVEEVCVPVNNKSRKKSGHKFVPTQPMVSFLDSISIPDDDPSPTSTSTTPATTAEEATVTSSPAKNSSPSTLPLLTTYLNYMRNKGSVMETNSTVSNMESLSIADTSPMEAQTETEPTVNVTNTSESSTNVDKESNDMNVQTDICNIGEINNTQGQEVSDNQTSKSEVQQNVIKCSCSCKCSSNRSDSPISQSDVHKNKKVLKTVTIQTDSVESFSFIGGFITPPSSDRTNDETSPESLENIDAGTQSNNDNNSNTYTYVPTITMHEADIGNSSPNQYESDGEIQHHSYPGACDTSTQISSFNEPENNQDQNQITTHHIEDTSANIPEQNSVEQEQESPESFNSSLSEIEQEHAELISEIEVNEVMLPPVEACEEVNVSEMDDYEDLHESELEHCSNIDTEEPHEDYEALNSVESAVAVTENELEKDNPDLNTMQVIVTETQEVEGNDFVIPMDIIVDNYQIPDNEIGDIIVSNEKSAVVNDYESCIANAEFLYVQNTNKDDPIYNKLSVFKQVEIEKEGAILSPQNDQVNNGSNKAGDTLQNFVTNNNLNLAENKELLVKPNSKSVPYNSDNCKIQASINVAQLVNKTNLKTVKKLNGEHVKRAKNKNLNVEEKRDKIIFTSKERVSAPLSVFAQFEEEQSQSDLVENALSGPIEPINSKPSISSDNSNSNDSFYLFESNRSSSTKELQKHNTHLKSPKADSPISPPYEAIHSQEFENHILSVTSLVSKPKHPVEKVSGTNENRNEEILDKRDNRLNNIEQNINKSSINKRKHVEESATVVKKPRVNFGSTEIRIIPPDKVKLLSDDIIEEAWESMKQYKISTNDSKLVYLQPQVPVKADTSVELEEKEKKMKFEYVIQCLLDKNTQKLSNSCIVKRVDYKKPIDENVPLNSTSRPLERSTMDPVGPALLNSKSKQVETPSISSFSPPSGYVPTLHSYESGVKSRIASTVRDNEDDRKYSADSNVPTRKRRTIAPKPKKEALPKTLHESSVEKTQRRPRGRPRKKPEDKPGKNLKTNPKNKAVSGGVSYSDGPFRLV